MGYIGGFDQFVLGLVQGLPAGLRPVMVFITHAGSPPVFVVLLLGITAVAYKRKMKQLLVTSVFVLMTLPLASILKTVTHRLRPDTPYVQSMLLKTYSFPSGHAYISLVVGGFMAYLAWRYIRPSWRWPVIIGLVLLIFLVGLSRIYLGAHFPSDVLGGWLLGLMVLVFIRFALVSRLLRS